MSFLIDIPMMIVLGIVVAWIYKEHLKERNKDWFFFLGFAVTIIFWVVASALYLRLISMPSVGIADGRYFMWNMWWNLGIDPSGVGMHLIAFLLFLSYPLWFLWGAERGYQFFGREPGSGGTFWVLTLKDKRPKG